MESSQKEEGFSSEETIGVESKKRCSGCKTTKTPLWRSGPSGPKSLCNACGIRYRKKRPSPCAAASEAKQGKLEKSRNSKVRVNLVPLGKDVEVTEGQRSPLKKPRQWGEVERAALLLMALSCGAVFA